MKLDLVSRIDKGTLRFYVARGVLSHEKIYLLSAKDRRRRVIMGSANMSFYAFGGRQRENICCLDGDRAYDWYWDCYCQSRDDSTDEIAKDTLLTADSGEHLEELPISRTIRVRKALVLQPVEEVKEEVPLDVKSLATKLGSALQPLGNGRSKQQTRKQIATLRDLVRFKSRSATPITQHAVLCRRAMIRAKP